MQIDPRYAEILEDVSSSIERDTSTIYATDPSGRMIYTNRGWAAFAQANRGAAVLTGWTVGSNVFDAVPSPLSELYESAWEGVITTGSTWEQIYECSSPDQFRLFRMRVLPLPEKVGMLVVNDPVVNAPRGVEPGQVKAESESRVLCSACLRMRIPNQHAWVWSARWATTPPPDAVWSLCRVCRTMAQESRFGRDRSVDDGVKPEEGSLRTKHATLTTRQREIVRLVGTGLRVSEIPAELGIQDSTVRMHVRDAYGRIGVRRLHELAVWGFQHDMCCL